MSAPPSGHVRLATASPATHPDGTAATLSQLEAIARRAAADKADLLLLPEAYLGGYPRGADFGAIIGGRSAKGRAEYAAYFRQAIDLGDVVGPFAAGAGDAWLRRELPASSLDESQTGGVSRGDGTREALERIAAQTGVFLVTGLVERAGGSLYCSAVYVDPARGVIGKRRKGHAHGHRAPHLGPGRHRHPQGRQHRHPRHPRQHGRRHLLENYMPMLRQGASTPRNVTVLARRRCARCLAVADAERRLRGQCFVVSSNMAVREKPSSGASGNGVQQQQQQQGNGVRGRQGSCITEEGHEIVLPGDKSASTSPTGARKARRKSVMVEDGHEVVLGCDDDNGKSMPEGLKPSVDWTNGTKRADDAASGWSCRGGSSIVGPFGDVLAGPQWEDDETIIYADVNFEDCVGGRLDLDAGSSYSRNDSFKFSVEGLDLEPLPYY
ncbi:nitrilase [Verticillium alfalfae VaMs.102]|uniref:Nitrilase n=1 Tax=Verticillium alfalfae (strain VaMs.102 / ATCC MYA-4576 / FGSC 10136) TaxID=526221 RepID=C9SJN1_VERA1|nr:nitrilase [Verticillium alfalfae VaMs.102]EEY19645.1 nitrilase [Verticillium alfalfae VaMs.102]